jgi:hypothetical protein
MHRACVTGLSLLLVLSVVPTARAAEPSPKVYVTLWFDAEDYLLPADDDATLRLAEFLSREKIRATFKLVGEKARTLERRGRHDVIAALRKHELGYHSNFHSVQPSPAMYLSDLGWDEGVAEFERREGPGRDDLRRILGTAPTCYGQPGSSWGPQVYGALKKWGVGVYLDAGSHVKLDDKPYYYCGVLNCYRLAHTLRANRLNPAELPAAETRFLQARKQLLAEGGGIVSIFYHPCEFVHARFWDDVNFRNGANPPRERWVAPPAKTPEETRTAYEVFENYIRFIRRFPDVEFVTARDLARLYADRAPDRTYSPAELKAVAAALADGITYQRRDGYTLAAGEAFALLNEFVARRGTGHDVPRLEWQGTPMGPSGPGPALAEPVKTDWSQFTRSATDIADFLRRHRRVPTSVWLGSVAVPPESYLQALAAVTVDLVEGKPTPETVEVKPAKLTAAARVADDGPNLWGWIIFPRGFRAPAMMELAKRQAWTLKPAFLNPAGVRP